MYPAVYEAARPPQVRRDFEQFTSTEPRFSFDAYCNVQWLLVHEPIASGAVMWFDQYPEESIELDVVRPFGLLQDFSSRTASGALTLDAGLSFSDMHYSARSTPLKPTWQAFWLDVARHQFRNNWFPLTEIVTYMPAQELAAISAQPVLTLPDLLKLLPPAKVNPPLNITTSYSKVLATIKDIGPWSLTKLSKFLGTSHTQLGRVLTSEAVPNDELAPRIDELHRFTERLTRLTRGDATVTKRLLTTPRERDRLSANDFLERCDYRNAFRAVMEAASPRTEVEAVESLPRLWYNEPSRDLYDNEVAPDE